ncbi:MAG: hypothetical protein BYD32DRAFT_465779 [Podila humilis]|nr:MAG: hypothetical protein BYD32DRAFT_465779 [Podila humilis]
MSVGEYEVEHKVVGCYDIGLHLRFLLGQPSGFKLGSPLSFCLFLCSLLGLLFFFPLGIKHGVDSDVLFYLLFLF